MGRENTTLVYLGNSYAKTDWLLFSLVPRDCQYCRNNLTENFIPLSLQNQNLVTVLSLQSL